MSYSLIPLTTSPNQTFEATIEIDGINTSLSFFLRYSEIANYWLLDISKAGVMQVSALSLVPGDYPAGNLMRPYKYLNLGSIYLIKAFAGNAEEYPGIDTLGSEWVMIWGDTDG